MLFYFEQYPEQAQSHDQDECRHCRLPVALGVLEERIGQTDRQYGKADRQPEEIGGDLRVGKIIDKKITKYQDHPHHQAGLGIAIVKADVMFNKTLFVVRVRE